MPASPRSQSRQQLGVRACPDGAQTVERRHHALCVRLNNRQLEGAQVDFAQRLLVAPGADARAVVLLIVQDEVLVVDVHALALDAHGLLCVNQTRQDAVLGVILKHAARIGGAVDVQTRAVQTRVACPHGVLANQFADLLHQLAVHRCGDNAVAGVAGTLHVLIGVVRLHRVAVRTDGVFRVTPDGPLWSTVSGLPDFVIAIVMRSPLAQIFASWSNVS